MLLVFIYFVCKSLNCGHNVALEVLYVAGACQRKKKTLSEIGINQQRHI
jgi:hypothetical protein